MDMKGCLPCGLRCGKQHNANDCGVHVICNAELILEEIRNNNLHKEPLRNLRVLQNFTEKEIAQKRRELQEMFKTAAHQQSLTNQPSSTNCT